jgi:hypothetical protein
MHPTSTPRRLYRLLPFILPLLLLLLTACDPALLSSTAPYEAGRPLETPVTALRMGGPAALPGAEFSGMAWYGDTLILLPQYPDFTNDGKFALYALPKQAILDHLSDQGATPLEPVPVTLLENGLRDILPAFAGFESIAFDGDRAYLTIEAWSNEGAIGYLVGAWVDPDSATVSIDTSTITLIPPQSAQLNVSDETLVATPSGPLTIYELNGAQINPSPVAHRFDAALQPIDTMPFPNVEYRITDGTPLDADGRFWAINFHFPTNENPDPESDPIADQYGRGATHNESSRVERLLEFQYDGAQVTRTETPPLQLELSLLARNWEGIVRLDDLGFLLVTDKFPGTLLGFVPHAAP